jgi:hypothetical protein
VERSLLTHAEYLRFAGIVASGFDFEFPLWSWRFCERTVLALRAGMERHAHFGQKEISRKDAKTQRKFKNRIADFIREN